MRVSKPFHKTKQKQWRAQSPHHAEPFRDPASKTKQVFTYLLRFCDGVPKRLSQKQLYMQE